MTDLPAPDLATDTNAWVARRIREAREELGLSQEQLARRLGRTQTAVSYWESGKRSPGLDDLMVIADAFGRPIDYFLPSQPIRALLRATAARLASDDLGKILDDFVDKAEASPPPRARFSVTGTTPQRAAVELLEQGRVRRPPVPIERLAKASGVVLIEKPMPDALSGLVFELDDHGVVGVNAHHPEHRRRFSIAHELGHYLLEHHDRFHLDIEAGQLASYDWSSERAANEFAAEVLMPTRMVAEAFTRNPSAAVLADRFNVSELAMGYRLVNLGLR